MRGHALLSASSSHRWIHCPPSIRLGEKYENRGSEYAAEGTEAHLLCEYRLKQMLGIDMEDPVPGLQYYSKEMEANAEGYAQYVMDRYRGWDLKPVVSLRGFTFRYVDNAPCSGLVTYFDGRSYLLFTGCGDVGGDTLKPLYEEAGRKLKLKESLKRESRPNIFGGGGAK